MCLSVFYFLYVCVCACVCVLFSPTSHKRTRANERVLARVSRINALLKGPLMHLRTGNITRRRASEGVAGDGWAGVIDVANPYVL